MAEQDRTGRRWGASWFDPEMYSSWMRGPWAGGRRDGSQGARRVGRRGLGRDTDYQDRRSDDPFEQMRLSARRMFEVYLDFVETMAGDVLGMAGGDRGWAAAFDEGREGDAPLRLSGPPGSAPYGEVWLKNDSATTLRGIRLRATPLESHDGIALTVGDLRCDPESIEEVDPGANIPVKVTASLPDDATPGIYHGLLLAEGVPSLSKPILAEVLSTPAPAP